MFMWLHTHAHARSHANMNTLIYRVAYSRAYPRIHMCVCSHLDVLRIRFSHPLLRSEEFLCQSVSRHAFCYVSLCHWRDRPDLRLRYTSMLVPSRGESLARSTTCRDVDDQCFGYKSVSYVLTPCDKALPGYVPLPICPCPNPEGIRASE